MSSCEKCWAESGGDPDRYTELLHRKPRCTPEEQAGPYASRCPHCRLLTIHQHTKEPMCGCYARTSKGVTSEGA
jgi:hypothetical protein